jgi:hypothetical protein
MGCTGGTGSTASGPELPDWSSLRSCSVTGDSIEAYVGIWDGGIEDFFLNSFTRIRLEITAASLDGVCGTLTWGFGTDPPPALTDPNETGAEYGFGGYPGVKLHEGVTYTILDGAARDDTLRVGITQAEVWIDFCEMQERTYYYGGAWNCIEPHSIVELPSEGGTTCTIATSHGDATHPIKVCSGCAFSSCTCNSAACTASGDQRTLFDFSLEGASSDVLTMPWGVEQQIRLTRAE